MLIIWVNILCVLFLSYVYFKLCEAEKAGVANEIKKWLIIFSVAGVFTKLGKSLIFILVIATMGWLIMQKEQRKKNA